MIIHVAPASGGVPVPELAKAFIVPKGCMVKINAAIWHLCPLPLNNEELHAMIILPETPLQMLLQVSPEETPIRKKLPLLIR